MTILHIFPDEKFMDLTFDLFDSLAGHTQIYLTHRPIGGNFRYIRNTERLCITDSEEVYHRILSSEVNDVVIFHSLYGNIMKEVLMVSSRAKIVWSSFGYDLYDSKCGKPILPLPYLKVLSEKTDQEITTSRQRILKKIFKTVGYQSGLQDRAYRRIDYLATVIPNEFEQIAKQSGYSFRPFRWNYPFDESFFETPPVNRSRTGNCLFGNSASTSNNHLDVLNTIGNPFPEEMKIYIPLSYGNQKYAHIVAEQTRQIYGEAACPLTEFIPFKEYTRIVNSCTHALLGHIRQQAVGNVMMWLYMGLKLFFYTDSLTYQYLVEQGLHVYTIDQFDFSHQFNTPLTDEQVEHNRQKVSLLFHNRHIKERLIESLQEIEHEQH